MNYKLKLTDITNPKTISDFLFLGIISNIFLTENQKYFTVSSFSSKIHCGVSDTESNPSNMAFMNYPGSALSILHNFDFDKDYVMEDFENCYDELLAVNFITCGMVSTAIEIYKPGSKEKYSDLIEELRKFDHFEEIREITMLKGEGMVFDKNNFGLIEIVRILKKYGL